MNPMLGRFRISWDFLDPQKEDKVLSIGCGEAKLELQLAKYVKKIIALDNNWETIMGLMRICPWKMWLECSDITQDIHYPNNHFDKVLMLEVLEHLPMSKELNVLEEIYRVLKPGGKLILSTPNNTGLSYICDPAWWLIGHRHYSMQQLKILLEGAGFTIVSKYTGGGFVELIWIPIFYILLRLRIAKYVKKVMDRIIDYEYRKPGFYTNIIVGMK